MKEKKHSIDRKKVKLGPDWISDLKSERGERGRRNRKRGMNCWGSKEEAGRRRMAKSEERRAIGGSILFLFAQRARREWRPQRKKQGVGRRGNYGKYATDRMNGMNEDYGGR